MDEIVEPRCKICSNPFRKLLNDLLLDNKYSLQEVLGVANAISAKTGISVSLQSLKRHRDRHLLNDDIDLALKGFDPEHETLAHADTLLESLVYALTILNVSEYEDFMARLTAEFERETSGKFNPPIWTVERFFEYWMDVVLHTVPQKYPKVKQRFIESIKKIYPNIQIK